MWIKWVREGGGQMVSNEGEKGEGIRVWEGYGARGVTSSSSDWQCNVSYQYLTVWMAWWWVGREGVRG